MEWKPVTENPTESGWYPVTYSNSLGWHQSFFDAASGEWSRPDWLPSYWLPIPQLPDGNSNVNT